MKTKIFTLLFAIVAGVGTMFAADITHVKIGDLYYFLINEDETAIVTYESRTSTNYQGLTEVNIPSSIMTTEDRDWDGNKETYTYRVVSIGYEAFARNKDLSSVNIPNTITEIGNSAFSGCSNLTSIVIPNSVTKIGEGAFGSSGLTSIEFPNSVTEIAGSMCGSCHSLKEVIIPTSVTEIGKSAFSSCDNLTSIIIPSNVSEIGNNAFYECSALESVTLSDNLISIGEYAFYKCSSLKSIDIPESVTNLSWHVFEGCTSLSSAIIGNGVINIKANTFSGCYNLTNLVIGNNVELIGSYAFSNCSKLTNIDIPQSVTTISDYAFYDCYSITDITIPERVASIGQYAFGGCKKITSVSFGKGINSIGYRAFMNCSALKSVHISDIGAWCGVKFVTYEGHPMETSSRTLYLNDEPIADIIIPDTVKAINSYTFYNCKTLKSITIPGSVTQMGKDAFYGCSIDRVDIFDIGRWCTINFSNGTANPRGKEFYVNGELLTNLVVPDSVNRIGSYAFLNNDNLVSAFIPESVKSIGEQAFGSCDALTSINIPSGVTIIPKNMLYGCWRLASIDIPDNVTSIGQDAFYGCTTLANIICRAITPPTCGLGSFDKVKTTVPLYVPEESIDAYKTADKWKNFTNIYAIGSHKSFTVTFLDWDGTTLKTEQVDEGNAATAPTELKREGYTFTGWDKNFSNITANLTVTAQYRINRYEVIFQDWDKTELKKDSVDYGSAAVAPSDPEREGHTFIGWDKDFSNITSDLTVTAQYKINRYEVIFQDWDETELKKDSVNHGEAAVAPSDPEREGHTFIGWDKDFSAVIENMVIAAVYEEAQIPQEQETIIEREVLDLTVDGSSIDDWTIKDAILNEKITDYEKYIYVYDITGGIPSISYVTSKPRFQFQIKSSSDKEKAIYVYPGRCFEYGGKDGIINILGTQIGDTIKIEVAAKGKTMGDFEDPTATYPLNATTLTEDLTLPAKGSTGADKNGYTWRTLEFLSFGGDVSLKEFSGGFRIRVVEVVHVKVNSPTDIKSVEKDPEESVHKLLRNGQIYILRGEKVYTVTGQEVR